MKSEHRNLVNYFELSNDWQAIARSNNEDDYEDVTYIEPLPDQIPAKHILYDLNECIRVDDPDYDGIISISNNSAIGVKLINNNEACIMTYL